MTTERDRKLVQAYRAKHRLLNTPTAISEDVVPVAFTAPAPAPAADLPFSTEEVLDYLLAEANAAPPGQGVSAPVDGSVGHAQYVAAIHQLKTQLNADPERLREALLAPIAFEADALTLPPKGRWFPAYDETITPNPRAFRVENHTFETMGDLWGWIVNCGATKLPNIAAKNLVEAAGRFCWAKTVPSNADHKLVPRDPTKPLRIACFGDFGTGLVHSRYIAKQLAELESLAYAFHLGDVYYSGRESEYRDYFVEPLAPMIAHGKTQLFNLAGNHDQFSGNAFYWSDIEARQKKGQHQDCSYFRLYNDEFQVIGLDTNSLDLESYENPLLREWLVGVLREGKDKKRTNILLTSENPYDYLEPSKFGDPRGKLLKQLSQATQNEGEIFESGLVDFWIWCHVHYATFNAPAPELGFPFIGACIGHGGYPYSRKNQPVNAPFIRWTETSTRFPSNLGVRPDMGNNGYCVLDLEKGGVKVTYKDWMGFRRCEVNIDRASDGALTINAVRGFGEATE